MKAGALFQVCTPVPSTPGFKQCPNTDGPPLLWSISRGLESNSDSTNQIYLSSKIYPLSNVLPFVNGSNICPNLEGIALPSPTQK